MTDSNVADTGAAALRALADGFRVSRALHVAALLDLAGQVSAGRTSVARMAEATGTQPDAIRRILRALCSVGVFVETAQGVFAHTELSERLRADAPDSFRDVVLFITSDLRWRVWADVANTVRSGQPAAGRVLGMSVFDHYAANPDDAAVHAGAMAGMTAAASRAILAAFDFSGFRSALDIGGGNGRFMADILDATPGLSGCVFDLAHVMPSMRATIRERGLANRLTFVTGSFFDGVPEGSDLHLLKQVIHDWDDERATAILQASRAALAPGGRLLIVERVMPELADPAAGVERFMTDLEMMVMTPGGRERTIEEYRAILARAGFVLGRSVQTRSVFSILEAVPG
jgi:hypothetical protein